MNSMPPWDRPPRHQIPPSLVEWLEECAAIGPLEPWQKHMLELQAQPRELERLPKHLRLRGRRPLRIPSPPLQSRQIRAPSTPITPRRSRLILLLRRLMGR